MIATILVDDEFMILRGLQKLIDWEDLGFQITGTFQDPAGALSFVRHEQPQLLITDMNMPNIAGPDFISQVRQVQPNIAIIVLSGYGDFAYVRAGLQNGALDYLRKPVDPDELTAALAKAKKQLTKQAERAQDTLLARQQQVQHLLTVATGHQDSATVAALELTEDTLAEQVRVVAVLRPERAVLADFLAQSPPVVGYFWSGQDAIILLRGDSAHVRYWTSMLPRVVGSQQRPILISQPTTFLSQVHALYVTMQQAVEQAYFYELAAGLVVLPTESLPQEPSLDEVAEQLRGMAPAEMRRALLALNARIRRDPVAVPYVRQLALVFLMAVNPDDDERVHQINTAPTLASLHDLLLEALDAAAAVTDTRYSDSVQTMRSLVKQYYARPLQLTDIAERLHLNPVYLGQLFKKETGQTFSQYLADWRITQAKVLLRQGQLDIGLIAETVGYQNNGYFYKVFKKQVGVSPRTFREQNRLLRV